MTVVIGSVVSMWRYPVKSMPGEEVDDLVVTERGILGDRGYAVMERATGYIASAKHPFFDYAALHLLTTATLNRLSDLYPSGCFAPSRFRPNIVVAPAGEPRDFVENGWLGCLLTIGTEVRLHAIDPCPRCVITTLAQGDLPRDPGILRTVAQNNAVASATLAPGVILPAVAGLYASVLHGGKICRADAVGIVKDL